MPLEPPHARVSYASKSWSSWVTRSNWPIWAGMAARTSRPAPLPMISRGFGPARRHRAVDSSHPNDPAPDIARLCTRCFSGDPQPDGALRQPTGLGWDRLATGELYRCSLAGLQQRPVKTGGRLVKHARYYCLLLAEGHLTRRLFGDMLRRIWALPVPAG